MNKRLQDENDRSEKKIFTSNTSEFLNEMETTFIHYIQFADWKQYIPTSQCIEDLAGSW